MNGNVGRREALNIMDVRGGRRRLRGVKITVVTKSMGVTVGVVIHINIILSVRGVKVDRISIWYMLIMMHVRSSGIKREKGRRLAGRLLLLGVGVARCLVYGARSRRELRALARKLLPKREMRL